MDNFIDVGYYYRDKSESPDRKHARLLGHSELLEEFYYNERTPLIWAAALNSPRIVKLLIENGANINARTDMNANALMFAVAYNSRTRKRSTSPSTRCSISATRLRRTPTARTLSTTYS